MDVTDGTGDTLGCEQWMGGGRMGKTCGHGWDMVQECGHDGEQEWGHTGQEWDHEWVGADMGRTRSRWVPQPLGVDTRGSQVLSRLVPVPVPSHPSARVSSPFLRSALPGGAGPRPTPLWSERGVAGTGRTGRPPPAAALTRYRGTGPGVLPLFGTSSPGRELVREHRSGSRWSGDGGLWGIPGAGAAWGWGAVQGHLPAPGVGSATCDRLSVASEGERSSSPGYLGMGQDEVGKGLRDRWRRGCIGSAAQVETKPSSTRNSEHWLLGGCRGWHPALRAPSSPGMALFVDGGVRGAKEDPFPCPADGAGQRVPGTGAAPNPARAP